VWSAGNVFRQGRGGAGPSLAVASRRAAGSTVLPDAFERISSNCSNRSVCVTPGLDGVDVDAVLLAELRQPLGEIAPWRPYERRPPIRKSGPGERAAPLR